MSWVVIYFWANIFTLVFFYIQVFSQNKYEYLMEVLPEQDEKVKNAIVMFIFALIGSIVALHITRMNFGISAGVGIIALMGICIQNGVILISEFHQNVKNGLSLDNAILEGIKVRTRPVVMTAMMASIGLLPAALSTGIGSESQKPLAIVIIGGLITATILTLLNFPIIFWIFNRSKRTEIV